MYLVKGDTTMTRVTMAELLDRQGLSVEEHNKAHTWLNKLNDQQYEEEIEMINLYRMCNHLTFDQAQVAIWKERIIDSV